MKPLTKKIVYKRDPKHGWPTEWKWACSICGTEFERQSDAEVCCLQEKDSTGRPWLKTLQKRGRVTISTPFGGKTLEVINENEK